jgi:sulfatase maturation enzyme AslB (radical SAM superfamily)
MPREIFLEALAYLRRSRIGQVRFLGGEPTLHADFAWMVEYALEQGFHVIVFSNGLLSPATLQFLTSLSKQRFSLLLNTIPPSENNPAGILQQKTTMAELGRKIKLGVTIDCRQPDLDFLLDYMLEYHLYPEIRLGIAHPVLSRQNRHILPKFYQDIGLRISEFYEKAVRQNIRIELDCGFVPCMFPLDEIGIMAPLFKKTGMFCKPNLDLLADGQFIACYPLNNQGQLPLLADTTADYLHRIFAEQNAPFNDVGIFPYCPRCPLFKKQCSGGCLAQKINRLRLIKEDVDAPA